MKISVQSSVAVTPAYGGGSRSLTTDVITLTVLDKVNFDQYQSSLYFFNPPAPLIAVLKAGLAMVLAEYREWAGRFGMDTKGNRAILLNDAGARFIEATADVALGTVMPLEGTAVVRSLHPSGQNAKELLFVQVTRFTCGSYVVGCTMHHFVGDGSAQCCFLTAWGQATRGATIDRVPVHDRVSLFRPRNPARVEFEHRGVEFKTCNEKVGTNIVDHDDKVVVHRVHFSRQMISELKLQASVCAPGRSYSTLQCIVAHLWQCITKARGLDDRETTRLRIAVNGRPRICQPRVPAGYIGNVVLWAWPTTTVSELLGRPLRYTAELISTTVAGIDDAYFKSFIDFASSGVVEHQGLVPTADTSTLALSPDIEVHSQLGIPFGDLDFGGGKPFFFMPSYTQMEGVIFIVPSSTSDGGVHAYVSLFSSVVDIFKNVCYSMAAAVGDARL